MTPLRAAKVHCANYQDDGSCLGIGFRDDFSMYRFRKEGLPCLLCSGEPCSYFEEIIVPMQMSRETAEATIRAEAKEEAVRTYRAFHKVVPTKTAAKKVCRECRRVEVEGCQRFCYKCAERRRRKSNRRSQTKRRSDVRKTANSPIDVEALTNVDQSDRYSSSGHPHFGNLSVVTGDAAIARLRGLQ